MLKVDRSIIRDLLASCLKILGKWLHTGYDKVITSNRFSNADKAGTYNSQKTTPSNTFQ
jgi:hypothetical protein